MKFRFAHNNFNVLHGAFEKVKTLLCETVADVYIISGDLIDIPFYNMGMAIRYHELETYFHGVCGRFRFCSSQEE
ncbi:MAG: hypothetical protein KKF01_02695 [Proteobacteria bacterium]|nr:hypothetical protein [Pseudomonadota bacterium]